MAVSRHFLASKSGFPPENFADLSLQVVESDGDLNRTALQRAKARANQVSGIEDDQVSFLKSLINNLANGNFPESEFDRATVAMQDYEAHRPEFSGLAPERD
jgi:hypothetical protein